MSLISSAPFSSVTTYRKDFTKKIGPRAKLAKGEPDFANPIAGPYEEHILPKSKYENLPRSQTRYPNPKEYAEHVRNMVAENYPSTRIFLREHPGGPPDLDVIDKFYEDENRTVYMVSYCGGANLESKFQNQYASQPLPEGWEIALTTYRRSYLHPDLLVPRGFAKGKPIFKKENLAPNQKEREILEVKTGETIYISDISNTGDEIIKGKLHGDINVRPHFNQDDLLKAKLLRRE